MSSKNRRIQELFRQLKLADERRAPSFGALWHGAVSRVESTDGPVRFAIGASLAAIVFVSALIVVQNLPREPLPPSLFQWQSPTDLFLETPNQELYKNLPQLGTGYFDMNVSAHMEDL